MGNPAIVIVPGALHTPEHYFGIVDRLHDLGYSATAVVMPSLNSNPPLKTWTEDVEAIRQASKQFVDAGQDVVYVGHSYSGVLISEAAKGLSRKDRSPSAGQGAVVGLLYLCAIACPVGMSLIRQLEPTTGEEEEAFRGVHARAGGLGPDEVWEMKDY